MQQTRLQFQDPSGSSYFFGLDCFIPDLYLPFHPIRKLVLEDGVRDIAEPLFRHLVDFFWVRHILEYISVSIIQKAGDILQREPIVLRDLNVAHVTAFDV